MTGGHQKMNSKGKSGQPHDKDLEELLNRNSERWETQIRQELTPLFRRREYTKGVELLHQGELWDRVFLVELGVLRLFFLKDDGREFNKNFFCEGNLVFPVTPNMWSKPSLFGIRCLKFSAIWEAQAESFRKTLDKWGKWENLQRETLIKLIDHKLQREHDLLSCDGFNRYRDFCEKHSNLTERIPLSQLATYLGLTDVSLSRIRRRIRHFNPNI